VNCQNKEGLYLDNRIVVKKYFLGAGRQWLMPVILAIQEAEIRRIEVQIVQETLP
jgi:hypothetical protein